MRVDQDPADFGVSFPRGVRWVQCIYLVSFFLARYIYIYMILRV